MKVRLLRLLPVVALVVISVVVGILISAELDITASSHAQPTELPQSTSGPVPTMTVPSFADVAERVMPAVVSITTTELVSRDERRMNPYDFFFRDPRQAPDRDGFDEKERRSGGSGFIVTSDGYVMTNNHVVAGADRVEVTIGDSDREYQATVVGRDPATDLALLKIDSDQRFPTVQLGNSDTVRVGEWAIAIGNPLSLQNTVTVGVISAKGRSIGLSAETTSFEELIQTDAAINFGNSGGPLLNIRGEVIGINTAILSAQNLGFAVPVNVARDIYPRLRDEGTVVRGYLGIYIDEIDEREMRAFGLDSRDGALVTDLSAGEAAEKAGVVRGDVILKVDEQRVRNNRDLINYVSSKRPGDRVKLEIVRDGKKRNLDVVVGQRPLNSETVPTPELRNEDDTRQRLGVVLRELSPRSAREYGLPAEAKGLLVVDVRGLSPAADAGLVEGEVIRSVNGVEITSLSQFRDIVDNANGGDLLRLYVSAYARNGAARSLFKILEIP